MTSFQQEQAQRQKDGAEGWRKRMEKTDPKYLSLFCEHNVYIGSNQIFLYKCSDCISTTH